MPPFLERDVIFILFACNVKGDGDQIIALAVWRSIGDSQSVKYKILAKDQETWTRIFHEEGSRLPPTRHTF